MAIKMNQLKTKQAEATVSKEIKSKGVTQTQEGETSGVDTPFGSVGLEPMCGVQIGMGYTKNMGDYESARLDVALLIPCKKDEINEAHDYAKTWVEGKLTALIEELNESAEG